MNSPSGRGTSAVHAVLTVSVAVATGALAFDSGGVSAETTAIAAMAVWAGVIVVALGGAPSPMPAGAIVATLCLIGTAALMGASAGWSNDDGLVVVETTRALLYAGAFLLVVLGVRDREQGRAVIVGIVVGLTAIGLLALGSRLMPDVLTGHQTRLELFDATRARLGYPIYWNGLAAVLAIAIAGLAWLGAFAGGPHRRALAVGLIPPLVLALFFTGSRGGALAAAAALGILCALGSRRTQVVAGTVFALAMGMLLVFGASFSEGLMDSGGGNAHVKGGYVIVAATLLGSLAVAALRLRLDGDLASILPRPALGRAAVGVIAAGLGALVLVVGFGEGSGEDSQPFVEAGPDATVGERFLAPQASARVELWESAIDAFESEPLRGLGAGGYTAWWNEQGSLYVPVRNAHSLPLERLAELGVGGLLLIVGFFVTLAWAAWRRMFGDADGLVAITAAIVAAGVLTSTIEWSWEIPAVFLPLIVAAGVLAGCATAASAGQLWRVRLPAQIGIALLAVGAVAAAAIVTVTEASLDRSRELAREGELRAAAGTAADAAELQPFASEPLLQLGLVQEQAADLSGARASYLEAAALAPDDPGPVNALARIDRYRFDPRWIPEQIRAYYLEPRDPALISELLSQIERGQFEVEPIALSQAERLLEELRRVDLP